MSDESQDSRNAIVEHYTGLAKYLAQKKFERGVPPDVGLDDLNQFAIIGLMDAIGKFDPTRGVKFQTYAAHRIRGEIIDQLRLISWVPRLVFARKEVPPEIISLSTLFKYPDQNVGEVGHEFEQSTEPDPSGPLNQADNWKKLLAGLKPKERKILDMYYIDDMPFREIGLELDLSESRISQLHSRALRYIHGQLIMQNE